MGSGRIHGAVHWRIVPPQSVKNTFRTPIVAIYRNQSWGSFPTWCYHSHLSARRHGLKRLPSFETFQHLPQQREGLL